MPVFGPDGIYGCDRVEEGGPPPSFDSIECCQRSSALRTYALMSDPASKAFGLRRPPWAEDQRGPQTMQRPLQHSPTAAGARRVDDTSRADQPVGSQPAGKQAGHRPRASCTHFFFFFSSLKKMDPTAQHHDVHPGAHVLRMRKTAGATIEAMAPGVDGCCVDRYTGHER